LGNLLIEKYRTRFEEVICGDGFSEPAARRFIRKAWFVVSTLHDVGRPIQDFEDVSLNLRKQITKLLFLAPEQFCPSLQLRIDQLLYDDPRTYTILRELTLILWKECFKDDGRMQFEDLWWTMRYLTFGRKHHAMVSTVAVALQFMNTNASFHSFGESETGRYIAKHILLPILLHHISDWEEEVKKGIKSDQKQKRKAKAQLGGSKQVTDAVTRCIHTVAGRNGVNLIKFDRLPFAALLAICDFVQEWGRPSGNSKGHWPERITGDLEKYNDSPDDEVRLCIDMYYRDVYSKEAKRDFRSRKRKWAHLQRLVDRDVLAGLKTKIEMKRSQPKRPRPRIQHLS
jgi:hypothetical protein